MTFVKELDGHVARVTGDSKSPHYTNVHYHSNTQLQATIPNNYVCAAHPPTYTYTYSVQRLSVVGKSASVMGTMDHTTAADLFRTLDL